MCGQLAGGEVGAPVPRPGVWYYGRTAVPAVGTAGRTVYQRYHRTTGRDGGAMCGTENRQ